MVALTRELTNYSERIAEALRCPISELWGIFLAITGRMTYVEKTTDAMTMPLGVLDAGQPEASPTAGRASSVVFKCETRDRRGGDAPQQPQPHSNRRSPEGRDRSCTRP